MDKIRFIIKSKVLVTKQEEIQLEKLCFKDGHIIPEYRKKHKIGIVILGKIKDRIVAWGLLFERSGEKTLFLFTHKDFRRRGIGKKIYQIAYKHFKDFYVSRHSRNAAKFFNSVEND